MHGLRIHHIGIAVARIGEHAGAYVDRFGVVPVTEIIHDPVQTALVQFFRVPGQDVLLEFVAPDGPGSKLSNAVEQRGGGLNHLCFVVDNIEETCSAFVAKGMALVQRPVPAVAFNQRKIAWVLGRDRVLFELVQRGADGEL